MNTTTQNENTMSCCDSEKAYCKPYYQKNESDDSWKVKVDIPGVDKSGVSLSVKDSLLTIKAESNESIDENWKLLSDDSLGSNYCLKLSIGKNIDQAKITATVENGILIVTLPKQQSIVKREIAIS